MSSRGKRGRTSSSGTQQLVVWKVLRARFLEVCEPAPTCRSSLTTGITSCAHEAPSSRGLVRRDYRPAKLRKKNAMKLLPAGIAADEAHEKYSGPARLNPVPDTRR